MTKSNRLKSLAIIIGIVLFTGLSMLAFVGRKTSPPTKTNSQTSQSSTATQSTSDLVSNKDGTILSYKGKDGASALDLLKSKAKVSTKQSSFGEYVVSINGVDGGGKKFWLFYVDNKPSNVGAGSYITKNGETVEWRLQ